MFLCLEVLDASFSFDGVIGASFWSSLRRNKALATTEGVDNDEKAEVSAPVWRGLRERPA